MNAPVIYLASQSPRRRILLEQLGVSYQSLAIEVDERWDSVEPARDHVARLALEKARAGWRAVTGSDPLPVLAADTAVVLDGDILGKPEGREQGLAMLARLSGRCHQVYTAVALIPLDEKRELLKSAFLPLPPGEGGGEGINSMTDPLTPVSSTGQALTLSQRERGHIQSFLRVNISHVHFRPLTDQERESYWATGEPLGKAGGYAIQGLAAAFIERIEGSYSGVMGLPLCETAELLNQAGINVLAKEANS